MITGIMRKLPQAKLRSFPRKRESRGRALGPRFRGDERKKRNFSFGVLAVVKISI